MEPRQPLREGGEDKWPDHLTRQGSPPEFSCWPEAMLSESCSKHIQLQINRTGEGLGSPAQMGKTPTLAHPRPPEGKSGLVLQAAWRFMLSGACSLGPQALDLPQPPLEVPTAASRRRFPAPQLSDPHNLLPCEAGVFLASASARSKHPREILQESVCWRASRLLCTCLQPNRGVDKIKQDQAIKMLILK